LATFGDFIELTFGRNQRSVPDWLPVVLESLVLLVLLGSIAACVMLRNKRNTWLERLIVLNGGGMVLCFAVTWVAHATVGAGYPYSRTGVYWPVMLTLGGVALVERFADRPLVRWPAWILAALCLAAFVAEFEVGYYEEWRFDAGSKRIARMIFEKAGTRPIRIACSSHLRHSLNFYSHQYHARWEIVEDPGQDGDFHVLLKEHFRPELKLLYRDPVAESALMQ